MNENGLGSATLLRVPFLLRLHRTWLGVTRAIVTTQRATEVSGRRGGHGHQRRLCALKQGLASADRGPGCCKLASATKETSKSLSQQCGRLPLTVMRSFPFCSGD